MTKYISNCSNFSHVQDRTESQLIVCCINLIIAYHCMAHNVSMDYYTALFLGSGIFGTPMPCACERDGNAEMCVGGRGWPAAEDRNTFV